MTADEYLSGNVREKLRLARAAAAVDPSLPVNVKALEKAQSKELEAGEIGVRLGSTWIDSTYFQQFMYELLQSPRNIQNIRFAKDSFTLYGGKLVPIAAKQYFMVRYAYMDYLMAKEVCK